MGLAKSEEEWAERARAYLKAEIKKAEIDYDELVRRLKKHGFKSETRASITNKLARGTFTATFFLACLAALELPGVNLADV
jgi:SOS response regulatory protein OraA/RecX